MSSSTKVFWLRGLQTKPATAKKTIQGKRGIYSLSIDEAKWNQREASGEHHDLCFIHTDGDIYAYTISERIQFPLEQMIDGVVENAKTANLERIQITQEEKRIVNGREVWFLVIEGLFRNVSMVSSYYLQSSNAGSLQVMVITARNLMQKYKSDITDFLNGLELQPK
jgi:hypothetical protein